MKNEFESRIDAWPPAARRNPRRTTTVSMQSRSRLRKHPTLHDLVRAQAKRNPAAIAMRGVHRAPLSYGRLVEQLDYVASTLNSIGIRRNDRVAIALPNG